METLSELEWNAMREALERTIRKAVEVNVDDLVTRGELVPIRRGRWYQVKKLESLDAINPLVKELQITRWDDPNKPTEWVVKLDRQERWTRLARRWCVAV